MLEGFLFRNSWVRALIPLALMVIVGICSGALVAETTVGRSVAWREMPHSIYFYVILVAVISSAGYQAAIASRNREIQKGFTPKQYEARIRSRVAEDVARRTQKLIRDGNVDQLEKETEAFKKLFGEGQT